MRLLMLMMTNFRDRVNRQLIALPQPVRVKQEGQEQDAGGERRQQQQQQQQQQPHHPPALPLPQPPQTQPPVIIDTNHPMNGVRAASGHTIRVVQKKPGFRSIGRSTE